MKRIAILLALVASLSLPAGASAVVSEHQGIIGRVVEFPNAWPCYFAVPCVDPVATTFNVWRSGVRILTIHTRANGRFLLRLPPGRYTLRHPAGVSLRVRVDAGFVPVELVIPSGLI